MSIYVDSKTVASPGSPELLTTRTLNVSSVIIRAKSSNTGLVYIVDSENNSKKFPSGGLAAGDAITLPVNRPDIIKIDVSVANEGVDWLAV